MKKYFFTSLLLLFGLSHAEFEQPPFEVKDPAVTENFRNVYQSIDQLGVTTSDEGYVCIDDPTLCVDTTNDVVYMADAWSFGSRPGAFPTDRDTYILFLRSGAGGSPPFDQTGSLIIRPRLTATDGRSSVYIYTGDTPSQAMRIDEIGSVRQPLQPSFLVTAPANTADVTGNAGVHTIEYDTEIFDQGADFDTGTYTFTAPVGGRYQFNVNCLLANVTANTIDYIQIRLITSNRSYYSFWPIRNPTGTNAGGTLSILADMDAADTAYAQVVADGFAGDTIEVADSAIYNQFSGSLIN